MDMNDSNHGTLSRRSLLAASACSVVSVGLGGCVQQEEEDYAVVEVGPVAEDPVPAPEPAPLPASILAIRAFWRALNSAAMTLGAVGPVRFSTGRSSLSPGARVDLLLAEAGIPATHRNHDIIRQLYLLGVTAAPNFPRLDVESFAELKASAEPVLEGAYRRALGECRLNMPTCDIDITTRFKPPGTPGGAPDWATAWWDFSSP